ncbi:MAG: hypothetical protein ACRDV9_01045 [Acidimicrobiia bacterium]
MSRHLITTTIKKGDDAGKELAGFYAEWPDDLRAAIDLFGDITVHEMFLDALDAELKVAMRRQPTDPQGAIDNWVPSSDRRALRQTERDAKLRARAAKRAEKLEAKMSDADREALLERIKARKQGEANPTTNEETDQ